MENKRKIMEDGERERDRKRNRGRWTDREGDREIDRMGNRNIKKKSGIVGLVRRCIDRVDRTPLRKESTAAASSSGDQC